MRRGEIWWAELPDPVGSTPGYRRPVLIIQADAFNRSRIQTVIAAVVTSNLRLAEAPGNVLLLAEGSGLSRDSVINVSQVITLDKSMLIERIGQLHSETMIAVDRGLKLIFAL